MEKTWSDKPQIAVSWGEIFDKLTILEIKLSRLADPVQQSNVLNEMREIEKVVGDVSRYPAELGPLVAQLKFINQELWEIEDGKRDYERRKCFDAGFVDLARKVNLRNDHRAQVKKQINVLLGSIITEEKSHQPY